MLWITGLSGVGKTCLAQALAAVLQRDGFAPRLLDGDVDGRAYDTTPEPARHGLAARQQRASGLARRALALAQGGQPVIVATISLFDAVHDWNRRHHARLGTVLIEAPFDLLRQRRPALYGAASRPPGATVWGVDLAPEYPPCPDLRLQQVDGEDRLATHVAAARALWQRIVT